MRSMQDLLVAILTVASLAVPGMAAGGKPGGGGGGSATRVEDLGRPAGSVNSAANAINEAGSVVVGAAYWNATFEYPNNRYAARWTRSAATGAWQAEDLRTLLPPHKRSSGTQVNDAGTVVVSVEYRDSTQHWFVITSAGPMREFGPIEAVADLDEGDRLIGTRYAADATQVAKPLYWASPTAAVVELPVLQPGYGGQTLLFQGLDILGTLADASGDWLVRWRQVDGAWNVERVLQLPRSYSLTGVSPGGRVAFMHCTGTRYYMKTPIGCEWRAAVWDPPYAGAPAYLPNLAGTYSWTGGVMDDGTVTGLTVASNGVDMLPVLWPTPTTLMQLPLLTGGKAGAPGGFNSHRQLVGSVNVPIKGLSTDHAVLWTLP